MAYIILRPLGLSHPQVLGLGQGPVAAAEGGLGFGEVAFAADLFVGHAFCFGFEEEFVFGRAGVGAAGEGRRRVWFCLLVTGGLGFFDGFEMFGC